MPDDQMFTGATQWASGTLLARLSAEAREELLRLSTRCHIPAGTVLLHQGDTATRHAYILLDVRGHQRTPTAVERSAPCVKITARLPNGTEGLLGIRLCGDVVGELAALYGSPRSATATTCSDVVAHVIKGMVFKSFLDRYPEAWPALGGIIADRLEWANQRRLDFAGYPVAVRLARILLLLARQHGHPVAEGVSLGVALSHEELGMLIGAGRDAVGQAVAKLKRAGLISTSYRTIIILDLNKLDRYGHPND